MQIIKTCPSVFKRISSYVPCVKETFCFWSVTIVRFFEKLFSNKYIYGEEFFFPKSSWFLQKNWTKVAFRPAAAGFKNAVEDLKNGKLGFGFNILYRAWNYCCDLGIIFRVNIKGHVEDQH